MWLTVKEASARYKIKVSTLYLWVEQGAMNIPYYRIGRLIRFRADEFDMWMKGFKTYNEVPAKKKVVIPLIDNESTQDVDSIIRKAIDGEYSCDV